MAKPVETSVAEVETGAPDQSTPVVRERKQRTPVGGARDILTIPGMDPKFHYRWVRDNPGRIQRFQEGGWEVVTDDLEVGQNTVDRNTKLGSGVTKASGDGGVLVAMRIPKEWFDEDQAAKQAKLDAMEATMKQEAMLGRYGVLEVTRKRN